MTDIVERLRFLGTGEPLRGPLMVEAALEIEQLRAANIGLATESHNLQQEVERLGSVADAEMRLREGNFAEIERLRAALDKYRGQVDRFGQHSAADALRATAAPGAAK